MPVLGALEPPKPSCWRPTVPCVTLLARIPSAFSNAAKTVRCRNVPTSYAQTTQLTCTQCGRDFTAQVWLILDAAERPDLVQRAREGTLHDAPCSHCGHQGQVDAPLLIYRPDAEPRLIFSSAQQTTAEQDREQAGGLLGLLAQALGPAWDDAWLETIATVPRNMLPVALTDDPEAMLQQLAEQAAPELERLQREDPEGFRALQEAAEKATQALAEEEERGAQAEGGEQVGESAGGEASVGGKGAGIDAALLDVLQQFINARTWPASQRIVEEHPELLSEEADTLLERLAQAQDNTDAPNVVEQLRALLRRCREVGVERAFAEVTAGAGRGGLNIPPDSQSLIRELSQLPRRSDMPRRIEVCRQILAQVDRRSNPALWAALQVELANSLAQTPLGDRAENIEQAIHHYQLALEVYTREAFPEQWAGTTMGLANAFSDRIRGDRAANIEQAIQPTSLHGRSWAREFLCTCQSC